ncbi:potassium transporter KefB [Methanothermobacter thermautotrophicus]|uniref:Potassium transporter KefB n=1 Tax=Methanothermobacter thermautotrophicus TaxID=145262 RepID=A0A842YJK0_METTF|nr:cation:proton antiporter [Methanothermobacter thermautotrophicus]MBE2899526.1 potassium transporter KefB [Methanothermobacter thermautotrophicus]
MIAGPSVLGAVSAGSIESLAELGVILLLFTIGLEMSPERFGEFRRTAFIGGTLQIGLTVSVVSILTLVLGLSPGKAVFLGFLISLSSTAVVLKVLQDFHETEAPHGQASLAILIFQDVAAVPMILTVPFLAGLAATTSAPVTLLTAGAVLLGTLVSARWLVPRLFDVVAATGSREIFLLTVILVCASVTWLTGEVGLSPALGAFLAGLIVANTEYAHRAQGTILPFQEVFLSFFFVSLGMLLDLRFFLGHIYIIVLAVIGVLLIKVALNSLVGFILGYSARVVVLLGLVLAQIGEFSFILSETGLRYGLMDRLTFQAFLSVSLITMAITPFLISLSPRISERIVHAELHPRIKNGRAYRRPSVDLRDHLIIIGMGITGRRLAYTCEEHGIPYIGLDVNPEAVRRARDEGLNVYYGDGTHLAVLRHFNVPEAAVMVVAIADYRSTVHAIHEARALNEGMKIIARIRGFENTERLYTAGADVVVSEKREATRRISGEIFSCYSGVCELEE